MALLRRILRISGGLGYTPAAPQWLYRKSHVINPASGAGTGYQIRITAHYGAGVDSGEHVYLNGKCRTDFGDIRFTGSDGESPLFYWMEEKVDGDYAVFWVKVEEDLSTNPVTIYIYYGNPDATTISIDFREDYTTYTEADPNNHISYTAHHIDHLAYGNEVAYLVKDYGVDYFENFECRFQFRVVSAPSGRDDRSVQLAFANALGDMDAWNAIPDPAVYFRTWDFNRVKTVSIIEHYAGSAYESAKLYNALNKWYYVTVRKHGTSLKAYVYSDYARTNLLFTLSLTLHANHKFRYVYCVDTMDNGDPDYADVDIENHHIRKYVEPEPSHGAWGPEETAPF